MTELDVPKDQVEEEIEPGTAIIASGAYGPRCKVAQMLSFVQTQKKKCPDMISFPLVIDSPNVLEQDKDHLESVIRTLLTWDKTENQIIVASIEGKETANSIPYVNMNMPLMNKKFQKYLLFFKNLSTKHSFAQNKSRIYLVFVYRYPAFTL